MVQRTLRSNALAEMKAATAVQPVEYIAAGAIVQWSPQLAASDTVFSTTGVLVNWQTISGLVVASPAQSQVSDEGTAQTLATAGPLAPGGQALLSGCAWTSVCATFATQGVDLADLRLVAVGGADQSVPASSNLTPVVVRVTDTAGDPVAGAVVEVYQTVDAWQLPCTDRGRCPIPADAGVVRLVDDLRREWPCDDCAAAGGGDGGDHETCCGGGNPRVPVADSRKATLGRGL